MSQQDVNLHASDPQAATPVEASTTAGLTHLKNNAGPNGTARFAALATALGVVSSGVISAINDRMGKSNKLAMNRIALATAALKIPSVKVPNLNGAIQTMTTGLAGLTTPDTMKAQKAASLASNVRNPEAIHDFEKKRLDQVADQTQQEMSELGDHMRSVNGLKKQVEST